MREWLRRMHRYDTEIAAMLAAIFLVILLAL